MLGSCISLSDDPSRGPAVPPSVTVLGSKCWERDLGTPLGFRLSLFTLMPQPSSLLAGVLAKVPRYLLLRDTEGHAPVRAVAEAMTVSLSVHLAESKVAWFAIRSEVQRP